MMTIPQFFNDCVHRFHDNVYLWENTGKGYNGTTYGHVREQVARLAAGMISLGIEKDDRIVLLSEARNLWVVSELAILSCGAVNVPLSVRMSEPEELRFRINHSGARMAMVSANQLEKIRQVRSNSPGLEIILILDDVVELLPGEIRLSETLEKGESMLKSSPQAVTLRMERVQPHDIANISYTSGTTADPKGIILTHANYVANVRQAYSLMDISADFVTLLILPWDHAFAHTAGIYCFMGKGASIASVQAGRTMLETLKNLPGNIREVRPHLLYTVPAIAKNFRKNIEKGIAARGPLVENIFRIGLKISGHYYGIGFNRGKGYRILFKPLVSVFDHLVFKKIRDGFGGRLRFFIGGGALLDIELQKFFYAIGIPMLQGYGLTEASPLISANAFTRHKLGSSGLVVAGLDLRICDDKGRTLKEGEKGEIVIRGENVMPGYWRNTEATEEAIKDGWLHTGDMGFVDHDGFLYVTGRFKSLLIADDGEKYSPEGMEETIMAQSPFISQCMLYNNQNPYTVVLVFPDREAILRYLSEKHMNPQSPAGVAAALEKIGHELIEYRSGKRLGYLFPQRWLPAAIGILGEGFTEENHLLNFQLKIVRSKVIEKYKQTIFHLYSPYGKDIQNQLNQSVMLNFLKSSV